VYRYEIGTGDDAAQALTALQQLLSNEVSGSDELGLDEAPSTDGGDPEAARMPFDLIIVDDGLAAGDDLLDQLSDLQRSCRSSGIGLLVAVQQPVKLPPRLLAMSRFLVALRIPAEDESLSGRRTRTCTEAVDAPPCVSS
jgi:hypothetical protein